MTATRNTDRQQIDEMILEYTSPDAIIWMAADEQVKPRSCKAAKSKVFGRAKTSIMAAWVKKINDHPLQLAWQEMDVPQCGYCQSG